MFVNDIFWKDVANNGNYHFLAGFRHSLEVEGNEEEKNLGPQVDAGLCNKAPICDPIQGMERSGSRHAQRHPDMDGQHKLFTFFHISK